MMIKKVIPKKEIILPYPEDAEKDFLLKIININLDFYQKVCYTEIKKWYRLWKLLTFNKYDDLNVFIKNEKLLQNYQSKLHSLSNNEEYKKMILNDIIIENVEREAYFNAGRNEGLEEGITKGAQNKQLEMIINMYNKGISVDIISECAKLTIEEVKEIIKQNQN